MPYPLNSLKWDPESGSVAIRTQLPEEGSFANMAWLIGTSSKGARTASTQEVQNWVDIPAEVLTQLIGGN